MISRRISCLIYLSIFDPSKLYFQFLLLIYYSYLYRLIYPIIIDYLSRIFYLRNIHLIPTLSIVHELFSIDYFDHVRSIRLSEAK